MTVGATVMDWRSVDGFSRYEISECGDLRLKDGLRRIKGYMSPDGYPCYAIRNDEGEKKHMLAHRLVCLAFVGPQPSEQHQVAHSNGSRLYCHFSNLRWALPLENHEDRRAHGTGPVGVRNPKAKLTEGDVIRLRREYNEAKAPNSGIRISDLARSYGIHHSTLCSIVKGETWGHLENRSRV